MLYCFGDCAHHPARFVIFGSLADLRIILIIILVFPILPIVGTCKIAQTLSNGNEHLLKCSFILGGCQSRVFSISHFLLLLFNCCLCVFNSVSCHSSHPFHIVVNQFLLLFIPYTACFGLSPCRRLLLGSQAAQRPKNPDPSCFQATLQFYGLMMSSCGTLC